MLKKNRGNGEKGNKERIKKTKRERERILLICSSQTEVHIFRNTQTKPGPIKSESLQGGPGHISLSLPLFSGKDQERESSQTFFASILQSEAFLFNTEENQLKSITVVEKIMGVGGLPSFQ